MFNLDQILEMWREDSKIDAMRLSEASLDAARLHYKYLELLSSARLLVKKREAEQRVLLRDKWLWYTGKMDKTEMDKRGWPYDPFNGLKILRNDLSYYFESDPDLQALEAKIEYAKTMLKTLEEIMESVKWRHQSVGNAIKIRQLEAGA